MLGCYKLVFLVDPIRMGEPLWARSHLHSVGPTLPTPPSLPQSSCPHVHGNSSPLEINVTLPGPVQYAPSIH
jgi:hypothetical protein